MGLDVSERVYSWARHIRRHPRRAMAWGVLLDLGAAAATYWFSAELPSVAGAPALISVLVAVLAGPLSGVVVALVGGLSLAVLVFDVQSLEPVAAAATLAIWTAVAYLSGVVAESLRRQVASRERDLSDALGKAVDAGRQADELRGLLDRILTISPMLHEARTFAEVADIACQSARGAFSADGTALYEVQASTLHLVAWDSPTPPLEILDLGEAARLWKRPKGTRMLTLDDLDRVPAELHLLDAGLGAGSSLALPMRTGHDVDLLLALWWEEPATLPDAGGRVAFLRFADQVALAVARVRAEALHSRLEASLLPSLPVTHPLLQVDFRIRLAERRLGLGGDFFDFLVGEDDRLDLVVGDVSGHGPDAAALGATLRSGWRALRSSGVPLAEVVRALDGVARHERGNDGTYATFFAATITGDGRRLTSINCGHPPPLLISEDVTRVETVPSPPLGFLDERAPAQVDRPLPERWGLFLYTDGLIEGRAEPDSPARYGEERLTAHLREAREGTLDADLLDALFRDTEAANAAPLPDDALALLVRLARPLSPAAVRGDPTNRLVDAYRAMGYQVGQLEESEGSTWLRLYRTADSSMPEGNEEIWLRCSQDQPSGG